MQAFGFFLIAHGAVGFSGPSGPVLGLGLSVSIATAAHTRGEASREETFTERSLQCQRRCESVSPDGFAGQATSIKKKKKQGYKRSAYSYNCKRIKSA